MGPAVGLIGALAGLAVKASGFAGYFAMVVSMALSAIGGLIAGGNKPKMPKFEPPRLDSKGGGRTQMVRQPVTEWNLVYGRVKKSGPMLFIQARGENNKDLYLIVPLAAHQCQAVDEIYLDNKLVELDGSGAATNDPWNKDDECHVWINVHLGTDDQEADSRFLSELSDIWTADHRLRGHCYLAVKVRYDTDLFPSGVPTPTVVFRGRQDILDPRTETRGYTTNAALCVRDYLTYPATLGGYGADAERMDDASFIAAANVCDETVTLKNGGSEDRYSLHGVVNTGDKPFDVLEDMLSSCGGTLLLVEGLWHLDVACARSTSMTLSEADAAGPIKVQPRRPRKDLFNAVKGVYVSPEHQWQPTDFPFVSRPEYVMQDGYVDLHEPGQAVTAGGGSLTVTLSGTINPEIAIGNYVKFTGTDTIYTVTEEDGADLTLNMAAPEGNPAVEYIRGVNLIFTDMDLPFTTSGTQAQRLAKIMLERHRLQEAVDFKGQLQCLRLRPTDQVALNLADFGWSGTTFVIQNWELDEDLVVNMTLAREEPYIYAWDPATDEQDILPAPELADVNTADTVAPAIVADLAATAGTGKITLNWTAPADDDLKRLRVFRNTSDDSATAEEIFKFYALPSYPCSYDDTGLSAGDTRFYWLKSEDVSGNLSEFSSGVSETAT